MVGCWVFDGWEMDGLDGFHVTVGPIRVCRR